jgi:hypothetical protein
MRRIILDAELRSRLLDLREPLELCDEQGHVIGKCFPAFDASEWDPTEPPISDEELERREQSGEKRYSTAEVLAHLEKL